MRAVAHVRGPRFELRRSAWRSLLLIGLILPRCIPFQIAYRTNSTVTESVPFGDAENAEKAEVVFRAIDVHVRLPDAGSFPPQAPTWSRPALSSSSEPGGFSDFQLGDSRGAAGRRGCPAPCHCPGPERRPGSKKPGNHAAGARHRGPSGPHALQKPGRGEEGVEPAAAGGGVMLVEDALASPD